MVIYEYLLQGNSIAELELEVIEEYEDRYVVKGKWDSFSVRKMNMEVVLANRIYAKDKVVRLL